MIRDESVAYALAAWSRFEDSVSDGLLRAVAGAFVATEDEFVAEVIEVLPEEEEEDDDE